MDESDAITLPEARQVLMVSFYLSQGAIDQQRVLFRCVHLLRPAWRFPNEMHGQVVQQLTPAIEALVTRGLHHPIREGSIKRELEEVSRVMTFALAGTLELQPDVYSDLLLKLMDGFVTRDYRYLCMLQSRPRATRPRGRSLNRSSRHDPHCSFFCEYCLLGHSCGCAVFDEVLRDVVTCLREKPLPPHLLRTVTEVVETYNRWHPETPAFISSPIQANPHASEAVPSAEMC